MLPTNQIVHVQQEQRPGCLDHATIERCAEDTLYGCQDDASMEATHIRGCTECLGDLLLEILAKSIEYNETKH